MGCSYRKSIGSGLFRVNFSKRGISYSVGVKGALVNFGPLGTYNNLISNGISYQRKIHVNDLPYSTVLKQIFPQHYLAVIKEAHNILSANNHQLTDTDSKDLIS